MQAAHLLGPAGIEAHVDAGALGGRQAAAGMEAAAARQCQRVGERAGDRERLTSGPVDVERGCQQTGRVGVPGRPEQVGSGSLLDEAARVHDSELFGDLGDHAQVMGDKDHREPPLGTQVGEQGEDLGLDGHIESGRRLVAQQDRRIRRQGYRDHDPLARAS